MHPRPEFERRTFAVVALALLGLIAVVLSFFFETGPIWATATQTASLAKGLPWSHFPPTQLKDTDAPQFVSVTFDDNFGLAAAGSVGGVDAIVQYYAGKHNPHRKGSPNSFDGSPIRTTFFNTAIYMVDPAKMVLGGKSGQDSQGRNLKAWRAASLGGHEIADHTVNHFNGGGLGSSDAACCRAGHWSIGQWSSEIASCRSILTEPSFGLGAKGLRGFRAPFLSYNDEMFTALEHLGFSYDSSLQNCLDDAEDGANCSWPYTLDDGSPDADAFSRKLTLSSVRSSISGPKVSRHPELWEAPVTTLIVPPNDKAVTYKFGAGLRERIAARGPLPYPSIYEPQSGKISGLDYALLIDAGVTPDEMRAILAYNLDLHLAGNRSPLIFVAHAHLYAFSSPEDNPDTPSDPARQARWKALTEFIRS